MTSPVRSTPRAAGRTPEAHGSVPLRVVPRAASKVARGPFVVAVVAVLAAGLLGVLALNTVLAEGSFRQHELQVSAKQLADREQVLLHEVDALQAPGALAAAAQAQGMVPAGPPAFLRLPDGTVLGAPTPATAPPTPTAVPSASAGASAAPSAQPSAGSSARASASASPRSSAKASTTPSTRPSSTPSTPAARPTARTSATAGTTR